MYKIIAQDLTIWLKNQLSSTEMKGYVLGVSGGIDSTLMAKLLHDSNIPHLVAHVNDQTAGNIDDINYIKSMDEDSFIEIDVSCVIRSYMRMFKSALIGMPASSLVNLRARVRESVFYHLSGINNFLVIGTVNKAEFSLGYFVKNSSIGDVLPFADLSKKQIRGMAQAIGIPPQIAQRKASGCNGREFAEQEWGIAEEDVDVLCENLCPSNPSYDLFMKLNAANSHKRHFPQIFTLNHDGL